MSCVFWLQWGRILENEERKLIEEDKRVHVLLDPRLVFLLSLAVALVMFSL